MSAAFDPSAAIYDKGKPMGKLMWLPPLVAVVFVTLTICTLYSSLTGTKLQSAQPKILALAAMWAVGPPIWFFVEYYLFYRKAAAAGSWELFKHGQQLAIAVWAGVAATLYAIGTSDIAKHDKPELTCVIEATPTAASGNTLAVAAIKCK